MKSLLLAATLGAATFLSPAAAQDGEEIKTIEEAGAAMLFAQCSAFSDIASRFYEGDDKKEAKQLSDMYADSSWVVVMSLPGYDRYKFRKAFDRDLQPIYEDLETEIRSSNEALEKHRDQCFSMRIMEIAMGFLRQADMDEKYLPSDDG